MAAATSMLSIPLVRSDTGNGRVLKETLSGGSYTQSLIRVYTSRPSWIAVDGSGNVYVVDPVGAIGHREWPGLEGDAVWGQLHPKPDPGLHLTPLLDRG